MTSSVHQLLVRSIRVVSLRWAHPRTRGHDAGCLPSELRGAAGSAHPRTRGHDARVRDDPMLVLRPIRARAGTTPEVEELHLRLRPIRARAGTTPLWGRSWGRSDGPSAHARARHFETTHLSKANGPEVFRRLSSQARERGRYRHRADHDAGVFKERLNRKLTACYDGPHEPSSTRDAFDLRHHGEREVLTLRQRP